MRRLRRPMAPSESVVSIANRRGLQGGAFAGYRRHEPSGTRRTGHEETFSSSGTSHSDGATGGSGRQCCSRRHPLVEAPKRLRWSAPKPSCSDIRQAAPGLSWRGTELGFLACLSARAPTNRSQRHGRSTGSKYADNKGASNPSVLPIARRILCHAFYSRRPANSAGSMAYAVFQDGGQPWKPSLTV